MRTTTHRVQDRRDQNNQHQDTLWVFREVEQPQTEVESKLTHLKAVLRGSASIKALVNSCVVLYKSSDISGDLQKKGVQLRNGELQAIEDDLPMYMQHFAGQTSIVDIDKNNPIELHGSSLRYKFGYNQLTAEQVAIDKFFALRFGLDTHRTKPPIFEIGKIHQPESKFIESPLITLQNRARSLNSKGRYLPTSSESFHPNKVALGGIAVFVGQSLKID